MRQTEQVETKTIKISRMISKIRTMLKETSDRRKTALALLQKEEGRDPFKILVGTILSHRTRDENTTIAAANLFRKYPTPKYLASANVDEVKKLIKTVGFYNVKAKNIILLARQLMLEFNGKVPNKLEDLLRLKSVGRKTANCVLVYGFGIPAIPVDTHVHRISNRLGIVKTMKPEETEFQLTEKIPKKYWLEINDLFVRFGQTICKPVAPRCQVCLLQKECVYYNEVISKQSSERKDCKE